MRSMPDPGLSTLRRTGEEYFRLVEAGILGPDDRVELLDGVIVGVSPQNPRHASALRRAQLALEAAIGGRAVLSIQLPLLVGVYSVPEPDLAVLPGRAPDYDRTHPTKALLVVEIAETSIAQDRLTKAAIYAAASVPEYWLVNLRDDHVEVFRSPAVAAGRYEEKTVARPGDRLGIAALGGVDVVVDDLLPSRPV